MKRFIMTLLALATITFAIAQNEENAGKRERGKRPDRKEMVAKRTQEMIEKYALSTEQAEKLKALNEKYMMGGPRGGRGPRPGDMKGGKPDGQTGATAKQGERPEKPQGDAQTQTQGQRRGGPGMRPDVTKYNEELKAILNDAQYKAYQADQEKRMKQRQQRREKKDDKTSNP